MTGASQRVIRGRRSLPLVWLLGGVVLLLIASGMIGEDGEGDRLAGALAIIIGGVVSAAGVIHLLKPPTLTLSESELTYRSQFGQIRLARSDVATFNTELLGGGVIWRCAPDASGTITLGNQTMLLGHGAVPSEFSLSKTQLRELLETWRTNPSKVLA